MPWIENTSDNYLILCGHARDHHWEVKDISWALYRLALGQTYSTVLSEIDDEVLMRELTPYIHGH